MSGNATEEKVPVKDVEKGLKEVCAGLEKDLKAKKVDPQTAKAIRCAVEDASKKVAQAAKAAADKDKAIDPRELDKIMKKEKSKFSIEVEVKKDETILALPPKFKISPKLKYKASKNVTLSFSPATLEIKQNKGKILFAPTAGIKVTF